MKNIIILGAGGMCREVISIVEDINRQKKTFKICGVLDDNLSLLGSDICGYPVIGQVTLESIGRDEKAVLCISTHRDILLRGCITARLKLEPDKWATLIHPQATVSSSAKIGPGVILYAGSRVGPDTTIGLNSFLYYNSVLHHDSCIGDNTQVCAGVSIAGFVNVGSRCYLGIGSVLRDNINVADDIFIGMGSVVTRTLFIPGTYMGLPAKRYL